MHKGLAFQEDLQYGGGDAYLAISPLGKVPAITTEDGGHLSESSVCCDYLEEAYPDANPMYPSEPLARGRVRQIMKVSELYLELPCRRTIPYAFTDSEPPEHLKQEIREVAERGIQAMNALCVFEPYVLGSELTMADIYLRYVLKVVSIGVQKTGWDMIAEIDGLAEWDAMMADSDIAGRIDADQEANGPGFFAHIKTRFGL
jgi:glutathione S-transferase